MRKFCALMLAVLLLRAAAAWSQESPSAAPARPTAAMLKQDSIRCSRHLAVDACYNAVRWNPDDAALLVALGDALVRAKRPEDAVRNYRRAAVLAPTMRGISAKINAAEKTTDPRTAVNRPADRPATKAAPDRRYSNAALEPHSH
jgi:cytochrome c-type biogenesis protein CcmH/NrfG